MNRFSFPLGVVLILGLMFAVSCNKETEQANTLQTPSEDISFKMELLKSAGITPPMTNLRTQITYQEDLVNNSVTYGVAVPFGIMNPATFSYYKFYGEAGNIVTIKTTRTTCAIDPIMWLYKGILFDSQEAWTGPMLCAADDNTPIPESCTGECSSQLDPTIVYTLPEDGWYTIAVTDFCSRFFCPTNTSPLTFQLSITGLPEVDNGINIGGCHPGVDNLTLADNETMQEKIDGIADRARNQGQFVSGVAHLTNEWKADGLITGSEKGAIMDCTSSINIIGN